MSLKNYNSWAISVLSWPCLNGAENGCQDVMKDGLEMALQYIKESKFMCVIYIKAVSHPYPWWFLQPQFHNLFSLNGLDELCTQCQTLLQWTVNCCFWTPLLMQTSGSLGKLEMTGCIRGAGAGPAGTAAAGPMLEAKRMNQIKGQLQKFWLSNNFSVKFTCSRTPVASPDQSWYASNTTVYSILLVVCMGVFW